MRRAGLAFLVAILLLGVAWPASGRANITGIGNNDPAPSPRSGVYHALEPATTAVLPPVAAAPEDGDPSPLFVYPPDERLRKTPTTSWPASSISLLVYADRTAIITCSAVFIGPSVLLTAAHCLYGTEMGGWIPGYRVVPGKDGASEPYGSQFASGFWVPDGWYDAENAGKPRIDLDWGLVLLPDEQLSRKVGIMKIGVLTTTSLKAADLQPTTGGYPGDKPYGTQWWTSKPSLLDATPFHLVHNIDVAHGQSGSPLWRGRDGLVVGIVSHGRYSNLLNYATRVHAQMLQDLVAGCRQMGCAFDYVIEEPATPTPAPVQPTPTATPYPPNLPDPGVTPTPESRATDFIIYVGGEGAATNADFRFSIGKRAGGSLEGWLIWAPYTGRRIENVSLSSVDGSGDTVSVWGKQQIGDIQWVFNLVVSQRSAVMKQYRPDGTLEGTWGGPLTGGNIRVAGP